MTVSSESASRGICRVTRPSSDARPPPWAPMSALPAGSGATSTVPEASRLGPTMIGASGPEPIASGSTAASTAPEPPLHAPSARKHTPSRVNRCSFTRKRYTISAASLHAHAGDAQAIRPVGDGGGGDRQALAVAEETEVQGVHPGRQRVREDNPLAVTDALAGTPPLGREGALDGDVVEIGEAARPLEVEE